MRTFYPKILLNLLLGFVFALSTGSVVQAQYCTPTYQFACTSNDFIDNVQFVTINQVATGCGNTTTNYSDYTSTISTTVAQSSVHQISVTPGIQFSQYFVAFIDFNQDQDFDDPGEFFDIGLAQGGQTITSNIAIPATATLGTTRIRVMCRYFSPPLFQTDVCSTTLNYGEVEDYGLVIIPPPPVDMAAVALDSPGSGCGLTNEIVTFSFANYGLDSVVNPTICYSVDGLPPVCQTYADTVDSGDTVTVNFTTPANVTAPGPHTFNVWVTAAGDGNSINDTLFNQEIFNYGAPISVPYSEDFESNNGNWSFEGDSSLTNWVWGAPNSTFISGAAGGTNAWVTNLTGNYLSHPNNEVVYMRSPCYDFSTLSADPFVAFSHIFNTESCCDESWLEMSTDAGDTWNKVGTAGSGNNWYNDTFADDWDGDSGPAGVWRTADNRLTGSAGSARVFLRFAFSSDGSIEAEGFGVDNVLIIDTIINAGVIAINSPGNGCQLTSADSVSVEVINAGTHVLVNPQVCYTINNAAPVCETIMDSIPSGSTYTYTFQQTANLSVTGPYDVQAYTVVTGDSLGDNDSTLAGIVNFPVINTFPYVENFESANGLWISGGVNNDWELGTPNKLNIQGAASGSNAWVTGTTGFLNYQNEANSYVEGPCFDLSQVTEPWVGLNVWWETDQGSDGAVLEYSLDGGATWLEVGQYNDPFNWYNNFNMFGLTNAGGSGDGWSGRSGGNGGSEGYVFAKHDLDSISSMTSVRFRVHFGSDFFGQFDGVAFDDFSIGGAPQVDLGNDTIVCEDLTLSPNFPQNGTFEWDSLAGIFAAPFDSVQTVTITGSGEYIFTYTDSLGFCGMDTIEVTINTTPVVDLGGNANICDGSSVTLSVDSMAYPNVVWSTSATTPSISVSTPTVISVDVTDTVGCTSADTITTFIVPLPQFSFGADTTVCQGDTFCFSTGYTDPSYSHIWSSGAMTETVCTQIVAGYWAIVTDSNGCTWSDSIILSPGPAVPTSVAGFDTTNCPIVDFSDLSTGMIQTYSWDFGDGNSSIAASPSNDYSTAGNGTYNVVFVTGNSCGTDTTTLTVEINCLVNITDGLDNKLFVYPNPNQGQFRILTELTGTAPVSWQIVDLQGRVVMERDYGQQSGNFTEDVKLEQAQGVYFLRFTAGDKVSTEKIIVE